MDTDTNIVNQEVTTTRGRLNLRITFDDGARITRALGLPARASTHEIEIAKLNAIRKMQQNTPLAGCGYLTINDMMTAYMDWYESAKSSKKHRGMGKSAIGRFGEKSPYHITPGMIREWVEDMAAQGFAYDTVRLRVCALQGAYSWLGKRGRWTGINPCDGIITDYRGRFSAPDDLRCTIDDDEYDALMSCQNDSVRLFTTLSRYTGLRPVEVRGLEAQKLDRKARVWRVPVTKTAGRKFHRAISVPSVLITWIANYQAAGRAWAFGDVEHTLSRTAHRLGIEGITCKTFRKDFAHRMERAGAGPEVINLHQGRGQHGVLYENYLRDPNRAVRIAGPTIEKMFNDTRLTIIHSSV